MNTRQLSHFAFSFFSFLFSFLFIGTSCLRIEDVDITLTLLPNYVFDGKKNYPNPDVGIAFEQCSSIML